MDGWKMNFLLGRPILRGYVSFREVSTNINLPVLFGSKRLPTRVLPQIDAVFLEFLTHDGSMGLVYLPIHLPYIYGINDDQCKYSYTIPMDPIGDISTKSITHQTATQVTRIPLATSVTEGSVTGTFAKLWGFLAEGLKVIGVGNQTFQTQILNLSGWWLNQPIWNICGSQVGSFPQVGVKIKNIWNHHLVHLGSLWGKWK